MRLLHVLYQEALPNIPSGTQSTVQHCVNHWVRIVGDVEPTLELIEHFRKIELSAGRSPATIEKTIYRVRQIAAHCGIDVPAGNKLRQRRPQPKVPRAETVSAIFRHAHTAKWPIRLTDHRREQWWRAWIATAAWTAWRLSDMERCEWSHVDHDAMIIVAKKTGKCVPIPLPTWLNKLLEPIRGFYGKKVFAGTARKQLRRELQRFASAARVEYVPPHGFRRFSINAWAAVDGLCGEIVHGCRLGVMGHYLDPAQHLQKHAGGVKIPIDFLPVDERDQELHREHELLRRYRRASKPKPDTTPPDHGSGSSFREDP